MSRQSVGFVGSPGVSIDSVFMESFTVVVVNGRFKTASSFVLTSLGTVNIAIGFRFA